MFDWLRRLFVKEKKGMDATVKCKVGISARVIRKDGTIEDLGIISENGVMKGGKPRIS